MGIAMPNILMSASKSPYNPFTIPGTGRAYSCASNSTLTVPDFDAAILGTLGWVELTPKGGSTGPTSGRPVNAPLNQQYADTTLSIVVASDGAGNWLNVFTGAAS
jgi:hypothetical protein